MRRKTSQPITMHNSALRPGTLWNYDGDSNGNVKKRNKFNEQTNNSARGSHFFVNLFAVPAQLWREMIKF